MKIVKNALVVIGAALLFASCSVSGPLMVTNNTIGNKKGEASRKIILGITFGHTDLGAITAARKGGITKIATVDWKFSGGFFSKTYTTTVTGE